MMAIEPESDSTDDENRRPRPVVDDNYPFYFNIIEELSWVGYHRARVHANTDFDRVCGGLSFLFSHLKIPYRICLSYEEGNRGDRFMEWAAVLVKYLKELQCPFKVRARDIVNMRDEKVENPVLWTVLLHKEQEFDEKYYTYFSKYFKKLYCNAHVAAKEFLHRLHCPNDNQLYDAFHFDLWDNAIIFKMDVEPLVVLEDYLLYARTGVRTYPTKYVPEPNRSDPTPEFLADLKARQQAAIEKLRILSAEDFEQRNPNQETWIKFMVKNFNEIDLSLRLKYFEKRFVLEGGRHHEFMAENKELEKSAKYALEHLVNFDHDGMEALIKQLEKAVVRSKDFMTVINKDLKVTRKKEKELRANTKNGNVLRYNVHKRELADAYKEKGDEIQKMAIRAYTINQRLELLSLESGGSRERLAKLKAKQEFDASCHWDRFPGMDRGITMQLDKYLKMCTTAQNEMKKLPGIRGGDCEDYREVFGAYLADCRNLLADWWMKSKIMEEKRLETCRRNIKLKNMLKKLEEDSVYAAGEFDKMLAVTRAIQECSHELENLESLAAEFKKPVKT